jgi:hypothetical protein
MRDRRLLPARPAALAAVFAVAACVGHTAGGLAGPSTDSNMDGDSPVAPGASSEGGDAGPSPAPAAGSSGRGTDRTSATPADGGSALPSSGLSVRCSASFATVGPPQFLAMPRVRRAQSSVAVDSAGNIVVATGFQQSFTAGTQTLSAMGYSADLAVVKLDPQCHVLWTRHVGGSYAGVSVSAAAVDGSGDAIVGGFFQTSSTSPGSEVDFGTGPVVSPPSLSAYVLKLAPSGATSWVKLYSGMGSSDGVWVSDIAASATDQVIAAMHFDAPTDFGGGVLSAGTAGTGEDAAIALGPDGSLGFAKPSGAFASSSWLVDSVDVAPDGSFWLGGTGSDIVSTSQYPGSSSLRAVHIDASGAVLASKTIAPPASAAWSGGAVRVGPAGDAIVCGARPTADPETFWTSWFEALAPSGAVRWTYPGLPASNTGWDPAELVRVDAAGRAWSASDIAAPLDLGAPVGTLTPSTSLSGYVAVLGAGGRALSGSAPAALADMSIADLALTPDGGVAVLGWNDNGLTVTKLGF